MRRASPVEIRESDGGPHLYGVLIQEGRAARRRREVFAPGSVEWPADGVGILTRHRGEPEARAVPTREADGRITIKARVTDAIRAAVEAGRRYMSVEFLSLREGRTEGGIREITRALVPDVALVTSPEYAQTAAEVRQRGGYRTRIKSNRRMDCRCSGKVGRKAPQRPRPGRVRPRPTTTVRRILFEPDAFDLMLENVARKRRAVAAISRGAGDVVATTGTGSLGLSRAAGGGLVIALDPLDTEAGRQARELIEAGVDVYARPVIEFEEAVYRLDGDAAIVTVATFSYVLVKPTDRTDGLEALKRGREGRDTGLSMARRALIAGAV